MLINRLMALTDPRAAATAARVDGSTPSPSPVVEGPGGHPVLRPKPRPVRLPPGIQTMLGGGHVNLGQVREDAERSRFPEGTHFPPATVLG